MEINGKTYNQMSTINILSRLISEPITYIWICYDDKIKYSFVNIKVLTQKAKVGDWGQSGSQREFLDSQSHTEKPVSNDKQGC